MWKLTELHMASLYGRIIFKFSKKKIMKVLIVTLLLSNIQNKYSQKKFMANNNKEHFFFPSPLKSPLGKPGRTKRLIYSVTTIFTFGGIKHMH